MQHAVAGARQARARVGKSMQIFKSLVLNLFAQFLCFLRAIWKAKQSNSKLTKQTIPHRDLLIVNEDILIVVSPNCRIQF